MPAFLIAHVPIQDRDAFRPYERGVLRTIKPLDKASVLDTARRTGKVLIVHSANRFMGCGSEVASLIAEEAFDYLDAPVRRLGGLDTPVPFSPPLENAYRPDKAKILAMARELAAY